MGSYENLYIGAFAIVNPMAEMITHKSRICPNHSDLEFDYDVQFCFKCGTEIINHEEEVGQYTHLYDIKFPENKEPFYTTNNNSFNLEGERYILFGNTANDGDDSPNDECVVYPIIASRIKEAIDTFKETYKEWLPIVKEHAIDIEYHYGVVKWYE